MTSRPNTSTVLRRCLLEFISSTEVEDSSMMHRIQFPSARSRFPINESLRLMPSSRVSVPLEELVRYPTKVPTLPTAPVILLLAPARVSFRGEAKAPSALLLVQLSLSASTSSSVGSLNPEGHGLLIPSTPCHRLSSGVMSQSELAKINSE